MALYENGYDMNYQAPSQFLGQYGGSIVNEGLVDTSHQYQQAGYLGYYWSMTNNITAHPVTSNVHNIWYPIGTAPAVDRMTATMTVDSNWQVIVSGESTAYSYNNETGSITYPSAPPIVAVRSVGAGRIVLFPSHSTFTVVNGDHPALQEITWTRGNGVTGSDVYQMFLNAFNWLAAPSLNGGVLGGYVAPPPPTPQPLQCPGIFTGGQVSGTAYKVLIGVHSAYSDGSGTVAQWAAAAQAQGYSILIFAENLVDMTQAKWTQETADCAAVTTSSFKAVAGIDYIDNIYSATSPGTPHITFDLEQWFDPSWLSSNGAVVYSNSSVIFGNNWNGMVLTNSTTNPEPPWYDKFYRGFAIYTYSHDTLQDSSYNNYLELARDCYDVTPYVVRRMYSPSEVAGVSGMDMLHRGDQPGQRLHQHQALWVGLGVLRVLGPHD